MLKQLLEKDLNRVVKELGFEEVDIVLSIPENTSFGDYSSNVALQLANQKSKKGTQSPNEIANQILEKFAHPAYLKSLEIAGPGFLNFFFKDESLMSVLAKPVKESEDTEKAGSRILVEFAHPNTHKAFHIGHFRNISIGESLSRILEYAGVEVFRVTYGGDIGPHVAKAIWGIQKLKDEYEDIKKTGSLQQKAEFLGRAYALGSKNYDDEVAKEEINQLNKKIYAKDPEILPIWEETRNWSIAYFDSLYSKFGTEFDAAIWESEIEAEGKSIVEQNMGKVFVEDDGAIIFPGEKFGLHNRVFVTSAGYPTYEAKELGLTRKEEGLFPFDFSLHVVANEQADFFKVVNKAIQLIDQQSESKKKHLSYGMVNLTTGKMSSRKGEVITAEQLIEEVKEKIAKIVEGSHLASKKLLIDQVAIGAIKFSYLKYSPQKDIAFDIEQSISLQGDSGPYVQYTFARTQSLIEKASKSVKLEIKTVSLTPEEREVLRQLEYFEYIAKKAADELESTALTTYLLNLSRAFNLFYQKSPVLGSEKEVFRLSIVAKTADTLKLGLYLLGIEAPERM